MIIGDSSALITLAIIDQLALLEITMQYIICSARSLYNEVIQIRQPQSNKLKLFLQDDGDLAKKYAVLNEVKVIGSLDILNKCQKSGRYYKDKIIIRKNDSI